MRTTNGKMLQPLLTFSLPMLKMCQSHLWQEKLYPFSCLSLRKHFLRRWSKQSMDSLDEVRDLYRNKKVRNYCLIQKLTCSLTLSVWSHNSSSLYVCFWLMFSLTERLKKFGLFWSATSSDLCRSPACMPSASLTGFMDKVLCKKEISSCQKFWSLCSEIVWIFPPCRIWQQTLTVNSFSLSTRKQVNHHMKHCQTKFKKESFLTLFEREIWTNLICLLNTNQGSPKLLWTFSIKDNVIVWEIHGFRSNTCICDFAKDYFFSRVSGKADVKSATPKHWGISISPSRNYPLHRNAMIGTKNTGQSLCLYTTVYPVFREKSIYSGMSEISVN